METEALSSPQVASGECLLRDLHDRAKSLIYLQISEAGDDIFMAETKRGTTLVKRDEAKGEDWVVKSYMPTKARGNRRPTDFCADKRNASDTRRHRHTKSWPNLSVSNNKHVEKSHKPNLEPFADYISRASKAKPWTQGSRKNLHPFLHHVE